MAGRTLLLPLLALASCGQTGAEDVAARADADNSIYCALGGANNFTRECTMERVEIDGAQVIVVRHPDGSFRRFEIAEGALALADGAPFAEIMSGKGEVDVIVGADRYSFPRTIADAASR